MRGIRNPGALLQLAFRGSRPETVKLNLQSGESFKVFSLMDAWVLKETIFDRQYEAASLPLQEDWIVVDIGAALGDYAVWAAKQTPNGRVIAVEPYPPSVGLLRENLDLNQVASVDVFEGAVAEKSGAITLNVDEGRVVQNSTSTLAGHRLSIEVITITLQELLESFAIHRVNYLKMDCEGGEYEILFSASSETLDRVERVCMEVHDGLTEYSRVDMIRFLTEHGYKTRLTPNPVHSELAYLYAEKINLESESR
jgi:FkbM family methyltransferase